MDMKPATTPTRVHISIDRLALDGFDRGQRKAIVAGLVAELQRQASEPGFLEAMRSFSSPSIRGGRLPTPRDAAPEAIGVSAARRLLHGLGV